MSDIEIKPCPFCGSEIGSIESNEDEVSFCCHECGNYVTIVDVNNIAEAIKKWNTRPIEEKLKEENKRLRGDV